MYTTINFKTKKALKEAVANGQRVSVYQPGPFGGETSQVMELCALKDHIILNRIDGTQNVLWKME